ncbi:hypothetical protein EXE42_16570 [Halorubrum sp. SP3]|uniref:hypothetical protein n=1 Tax=Halorubrum sp. SP3 TaxID=1537265 RepID=UPI0010F74FE8|nr:hypothetical protein [Halorubrum sp. SP3]TKX52300.1 hypothetical protein EXE42_16570 [Halorubrum sp. SP3]
MGEISVTYDSNGDPQDVTIGFGIDGEVDDDGVVQIDPNDNLWMMYSDDSHERIRAALLAIPQITGVEVGEYDEEEWRKNAEEDYEDINE